MPSNRIILGIDPGTNITGYGIIEQDGVIMRLVATGIIDLSKIEDHHLKLHRIFSRAVGLIEEFHPDELAIESPFFGKNVQSMLKLGRAQGIAIAAALSRNIPVFEYSPKKIKQSITGNGNASKEQVAAMLQTLLQFNETPRFLDATDGLAAAVCHRFQNEGKVRKTGYTGWKAFLAENPSRKA